MISAAIIDECLEILLRSQMSKSATKVTDQLFVTQGPLGSMWSKIQMARGLELIPEWMYADLERIRTLRNHFAHRYGEADFESAEVTAITAALKAADFAVQAIETAKPSSLNPTTIPGSRAAGAVTKPKKERLRFILSASYIGGWLESEVTIRELKAQTTAAETALRELQIVDLRRQLVEKGSS